MTKTTTNNSRTNTTSRKLNRVQKLLTAEQSRNLPPLYATDGQGDNAIAHVKYFLGSLTWYITEYDPATGQMFGLVDNVSMRDQMPEGELGYVDASELCTLDVPVRVINAAGCSLDYEFRQSVERDIHWTPKTLGEIRDEINPARRREREAAKLSDADRAAIAEFDAEPTTANVTTEPLPVESKPVDKFAANYAAINWSK